MTFVRSINQHFHLISLKSIIKFKQGKNIKFELFI